MIDHLVQDVAILVNSSKTAAHRSIEDAVSIYRSLRNYKDDVEAQLKLLTAAIDKLRREDLPTKFKEAGVTSITVNSYRYTITENVYASIPPDGKVNAYQWLRDNELGALIIETVNASTLSAQARALMEEGKELPPELFKVSILPNVSMTKQGG